MRLKDFLRNKGIKVGLIVLAVAVIVALSARGLAGKAGVVENLAGVVRQPVQKAATAVVDWLEGAYGYLYKYDDLQAENDALRAQLAEAQADARAGMDALEENARLRELLNLTQAHTDYVWESAKIVSWNASNWSSSFTISKGEKNGVEVGDCVITEYGALAGQVSEVGSTWATVNTVIDVSTNVGALVGEDGAAAMIIGEFALMQQSCVKLTYLNEGAQMFLHDVVLTSGAGGTFPQGVNIGTVTSIQTKAGGQSEYGVVTPAVDLSTLVQVFVIKDFDVVE